MPELLGRRGIGLSPAGAKTNELITKYVHTRGFRVFYMYYLIIVSIKHGLQSGRPHLVHSSRFIPESMFYTQSVMLSPHFIPQSVFYT